MCSLTSEPRRALPSAEPHRRVRCGWAALLGLGAALSIAACEGPAAPPDGAPSDAALAEAGVLDAWPGADGGVPDGGRDAGSAEDAGPVGDAGGAVRTSLLEGGHEVLFVGNSYVFVNDVPNRYRLGADALAPAPVRIEAVAFGGYRLVQHAADARTDGAPLARWLRTGTAAAWAATW